MSHDKPDWSNKVNELKTDKIKVNPFKDMNYDAQYSEHEIDMDSIQILEIKMSMGYNRCWYPTFETARYYGTMESNHGRWQDWQG